MNEPLFNLEAEQAVIGACLLNGKHIERVADLIRFSDFGDLAHQMIWSAMARLAIGGRAVDVVTLADALEANGTLQDAGGMPYVAELARHTPSATNVMAYAGVVSDLASRRRMLEEIACIESTVRDKNTPFSEVIDGAQGRLSKLVREDAEQVRPIGNDLSQMIDEIDAKWNGQEQAMGLSFGLADLDGKTMGMHPSQLILVGGRPSMGKTAFALNILRTCCVRDRRPAIVFSMEMDRRALRNRMTAAIGDLPLQAIRDPKNRMTDEHWPKLGVAVNALKDAPLIVDDRAGMSPAQIRGAAKRWRDHYGDMGVVVVDYLQLMRSDGRHASREQEVAEASRTMKLLAKELQCPVIALSQLNRGLEQRADKRPGMADLRESGSLEQDADLILFLYRDEVYHPDTTAAEGIAEIIISKQREGELGTVYAASRLCNARFDDLDAQAVHQMLNQPAPEPKRRPRSAMEAMD